MKAQALNTLDEIELRTKHALADDEAERQQLHLEIKRREAEDAERDQEIARLTKLGDTSTDAKEIEAALRRIPTLEAEAKARRNLLVGAKASAEKAAAEKRSKEIDAMIRERTEIMNEACRIAVEAAHAAGVAAADYQRKAWLRHGAITERNPHASPNPSGGSIDFALREVREQAEKGRDTRAEYLPKASVPMVKPEPAKPAPRVIDRQEAFDLIDLGSAGGGSLAQAVEDALLHRGDFHALPWDARVTLQRETMARLHEAVEEAGCVLSQEARSGQFVTVVETAAE